VVCFFSSSFFGSSFAGAGISFGAETGAAGATMAGPTEQGDVAIPICTDVEPHADETLPQESQEFECLNFARRRSSKPILLEPQPQALVVKPVNSGWLISGVPHAGAQGAGAAQATGAGAAQATGAAQAGAHEVGAEQLEWQCDRELCSLAFKRANNPMRGPHGLLSHDEAMA
jgi:hypothetical protein